MKWRSRALFGGAAAVGLVIAIVWLTSSQSQADPPTLPKEDELKPHWHVGDSWIVETASKPVQSRGAPPREPIVSQWKFKVAAEEKLGEDKCFRLDITSEPLSKTQPATRLWMDTKSMALRQLQTQLPDGSGGFSTITESYQFGKGQPAPVIGLMTALPIELPMFVGGRAGNQSFSYESISGPANAKRDPTDVAFAVDVTQTLKPVKYDDVRSMIPQDFSREAKVKPLVEVRLNTAERKIHQVWQAGQPWPLFTDNGNTKAKLVKVNSSESK